MTLDDWLTEKAVLPDDFGKMIGCTGQAVRRYRTGDRMPEPEMIEKIGTATNGLVTIQDLHRVRLAKRRAEADASEQASKSGEAA